MSNGCDGTVIFTSMEDDECVVGVWHPCSFCLCVSLHFATVFDVLPAPADARESGRTEVFFFSFPQFKVANVASPAPLLADAAC